MAEFQPPDPLPPPCPPPDRFVHGRVPARLVSRTTVSDRTNLTPAMQKVTPIEEIQFAALETEIGGRPTLAALLNAADLQGREARLAGMLADPANDTLSLAKLAAWARVPMWRWYELLKAAALVKGQVVSLVRVGERLPDVARGLVEDAIPGDRVCPACRGLKSFMPEPTVQEPNPVPHRCDECQGAGIVYYVPDVKLREMALQVGKLLDKDKGQTNVVVNNARFGAGMAPDFTHTITELDDLLDGRHRDRNGRRRSTIDVDVASEPAEIETERGESDDAVDATSD